MIKPFTGPGLNSSPPEAKNPGVFHSSATTFQNLPAMQENWIQFPGRKIPWRRKYNPLQYSYLENPMDRGAWWATVNGVAKESTWMKDLSTTKIHIERLLLSHERRWDSWPLGGGERFDPGPVTRLDHSELFCNKVLLKYKRDRESFWYRHQKGAERVPPC